ncbi:GDSL esterase/lipase At5g03610-like [Typha angustifolia]|uniref:GDSL esterase/lipase At5g03610-like n=1 Tax=Typha angustifolia TaxID=59011 RepID=UPI003C2BDE82
MDDTNSSYLHFHTIFFAFLLLGSKVDGHEYDRISRRPNAYAALFSKLFVFGDSYADTGNLGNLGRDLTRSWYYPYGSTFPKRPTGRFSDGRLLTDFVASFLGIRSPIPYKYRKVGYKILPYGMNFAVGGAGIFDTGNFQRNVSSQIDAFVGLINEGIFSRFDLKSSVALVVVSGNDYSYISEKSNSTKAAAKYIPVVVSQIKVDLKRLHDLGVPKVMVTNMHPLGCTPYFARELNYTDCNAIANLGSWNHNSALVSMMKVLDPSNKTFLSLNINDPFQSIVHQVSGAKKFKSPKRPCCESFSKDGHCGQMDENGNKQYTLCSNPEEHFYWDDVHITQAGWAAVFETLKGPITQFLSL